jgi:hypothetical protein
MQRLKVISGGQTGVDQAALAAAKAAGLQTGGHMPYGWQTQDGTYENFKEEYGMEECQEPGYSPRTLLNIINSDATLRIARTYSTSGEICTIKHIHAQDKPHLDIHWKPRHPLHPPTPIVEWLNQYEVKTLNVAGNSEKTSPGIYTITYTLLLAVFKQWKQTHEQ